MKKILLMALACLFLFTSMASANGWGLKGGAYDIVSEDDRYEDYYTAIADNGNAGLSDFGHVNQVIMKSRYDAFLMSVSRVDKVWRLDLENHTAVYKPGDKRGEFPNAPRLEHLSDGFKLSYGEAENYTFLWNGEDYVLDDVRYEADTRYTDCYIGIKDGLEFWESNPSDVFLPVGDGMWYTTITLDEFNITQMPRTLREVRQLTMVSNALMDAPRLEPTGDWKAVKDGAMLAVYSAPDAASHRSASGKASVSLGGDIAIYGTVDGWTLISYEVSPRTDRIGYVQKALGEEPLAFVEVPLRAAVGTFLTDDPFVSQYAQVEIPEGAKMTGLAQCGEYYAYVEYEADKLYRGFVPMKDLIPVYDLALTNGGDLLTADVRWDVMDALCGKWFPENWANEHVSDRPALILFSNGSYRDREGFDVRDEGNYRIYTGEDGAYRLYLVTEDNREYNFSLTLNEDSTITLDGVVHHREEYSTYGNG